MESKFIHKDRRQSQEVFTDRRIRNLRQVLPTAAASSSPTDLDLIPIL